MATEKQREMFDNLLGKKDLGSNTATNLRERFADLPDKSASKWIESLLERPDAGEVPPPSF